MDEDNGVPTVSRPAAMQRELTRLVRRERGRLYQVRMERLDERLRERGALAVRHNSWGLCGDRASILLDDDTRLRLWLFWPRRQTLAAIVRAWFDQRVGWILLGRDTAGEQFTMYAWRISVEPVLS